MYRHGRFFRSFRLEEGTFLVGRDPDADIALNLKYVSRKHCQIEFKGKNQLFLQDLGSANGTFVNDEKTTRCRLVHGDDIRIGEVHLKISHPSFVSAQVIPFPNVPTEPGIKIPIEAPEPPPKFVPVDPKPAVLPQKVERISVKPPPVASSSIEVLPRSKPLRVGPSKIQQTLGLVVLAALAGSLGYVMHQWRLTQEEDLVSELVAERAAPRASQEPSSMASREEVTPIKSRTTRSGQPADKKKTKMTASSKRKKLTSKKEAQKLPQEDWVASLDRSLGHLESNGFGKINELQPSQPEDGKDLFRKFKQLKASSQNVEVELDMPKSEELRMAAAEREAMRPINLEEYQEILRSQIHGVDQCFVKHVKKGTPGKVSIWFSIGNRGGVSKSGLVSSTYGSKAFHRCILGQIQEMKVSRPPWEDFTMTYTFRFGKRSISF